MFRLQCSVSPCSRDVEEMRERLRDYIIPYVLAYTSGDEVTCYSHVEKASNGKGFFKQLECDLREGIDQLLGDSTEEDEEEEEEEEADDREKRQADSGMEHLIANRKYRSRATALAVVLPALFAGKSTILQHPARQMSAIIRTFFAFKNDINRSHHHIVRKYAHPCLTLNINLLTPCVRVYMCVCVCSGVFADLCNPTLRAVLQVS